MTVGDQNTTPNSGLALDVLCVGNALLDVLCNVDEAFLVQENIPKGSMTLVDAERANHLYGAMGIGTEKSGGSGANTAAGVVTCGGNAGFIGTVAEDQLGEIFIHDLRAQGVVYGTPALSSSLPTGRSMIFVTPDGERTMSTLLGAAARVSASHIEPGVVAASEIICVEGYLFDSEYAIGALIKAVDTARRFGKRVALALSDVSCVTRHRKHLMELIGDGLDICLCNEAEATALAGTSDIDDTLEFLGKYCDVVSITRGSHGSILVSAGERIEIDAEPVTVVDTTGAGDLYAAGVLTGLSKGMDLLDCGRLGAKAAAAVISRLGARLDQPIVLT